MKATAFDISGGSEAAFGVPYTLQARIYWRVATLLDPDDDVEFLDGRLEPQGRTFSGTIVVFTATQVTLAELMQAGVPRANEAPKYSVEVRSWSRGTLREIAIEPDPGTWKNADDAWLHDYGDHWPHQAAVTLRFEEGRKLTLLMAERVSTEQRTALHALVHRLREDLVKR